MSDLSPPPSEDKAAMAAAQDLKVLRREMRARRRALTHIQQRAAARRLCRTVTRSAAFARAKNMALYIAADGEIDPALLCRAAWHCGKRVFLPVLHPLDRDRMIFVRWKESDRLLRNRYGIPEPAIYREVLRPWQLDLVLMPLVAFDRAGNRMGMGGGFYDRTFAQERQRLWARRPRLCGLAHRFQEVDALFRQAWDVPLMSVFTD